MRAAAALSMAVAALALAPPAAARHKSLDPVGTWSCVIYGRPEFGEERVVFNFADDGTVNVAQDDGKHAAEWTPLSAWTEHDGELRFTDARSGREYSGDLSRDSLGGGWRTFTLVGGWWCSPVDATTLPPVVPRARAPVYPPLIPVLTVTPAYPIQAIRTAKQGLAVTCFLVDADGRVVRPDVIELSDEIFRAPILAALQRSRYRGWDNRSELRPGCRSYVFTLESVIQ